MRLPLLFLLASLASAAPVTTPDELGAVATAAGPGKVVELASGTFNTQSSRKTEVAIHGQAFHINGRPTYEGLSYNGMKLEGLLMNARLVQATFDDLNPESRGRWTYPDGPWDPERNTREFLAAMPLWRAHGLLAFTLNLQGGSPEGYSKSQPWHNSAFAADGGLRPEFMARLERVLDRADGLGMAVILGLFYFGQDERLADEAAVTRGVDNAVDWLLDRGYRHVLVEINNECNIHYDHAILRPDRVHELIGRVKARQRGGRRLLAGTSYGGGTVPKDNVVRVSDFLLLHGNGVREPDRIRKMVDDTRALPAYSGQPILFNEDDHFDFDKPDNNLLAAVSRYASWGYFDFRMKGEGFDEGYQSVPVNWGISSERKRGFFGLLRRITAEPLTTGTSPLAGASLSGIPAAPASGAVVPLDFAGQDTNGIAIADFLSFIPLISPEPVSVSESPANTLRVRMVSIREDVRSGRFLLNLTFDVSGHGFRHYAIDQSASVRRNGRRLAAGEALKKQLDYIRYEGPGKGRVEIGGRVEADVKRVTTVSLHFDDRGGTSPVTIGLKDVRSTNGVLRCENELVARVNRLTFSRDGTPPRMGVRIDSVKARKAGDGFFQNVKGRIVGRVANTVVKPITIRKLGNDTLLNFGQTVLERKPSFTFPAAENLRTSP